MSPALGRSSDATRRIAAPAASAPSDGVVRGLLAQRVDALVSHDIDDWRATTAPLPTRRAQEDERLLALLRLPVSALSMTLEESRHRRGHSSVRVRTSYRLGTAPPAEHRDDIELVLTSDGWRLGESQPVVPVSDGGTVPPWYLPGVTAQHRVPGQLLLAWPQTRTAMADLAGPTSVAVAAARAAVPGDAAGVVVAAPDTAAAYRALVPGTGEAAGFAAVTADVPGPGGGDMVVLNPDVWSGLDAREQQVVLTHELVHVAVGAALGGGQPLWLAEGHADHVALAPVLRSGVTRRQLAAPLIVDDTAVPPNLPSAADFGSDPPAAYLSAWSAVDYLVRTYGEQAVLDLMARLAGAGQDATAAEARALRQVLGLDRAQLVERWQADLAVLAAEPNPPSAVAGRAP